MQIVSNTLSFIVALGVIIFVHELGHLLMAKAFRIRVLVFSLGFGKRLAGFERDGTDYQVALFPLGGYVRLGGELPEENTGDPAEFVNRPRWQRILVYLAGPVMNAVLAVFLFAVVFMVGIEVPYLENIPPVVGSVAEGSPAARDGLLEGDRVLAVDGREVDRWQDVEAAVVESPERQLELTLEREGQSLSVLVTPGKAPKYEFGYLGAYPRVLPRISRVWEDTPAEEAGLLAGDQVRATDGRPIANPREFVEYIEAHTGTPVELELLREGQLTRLVVVPEDQGGVGRIGVGLTIATRYGPIQAIKASVLYCWEITWRTFDLLGKLVAGRIAPQTALHGPIEIAALSGEAARRGLSELIHLMGIVSISIGILNLLPIPVLDGGQITILLVEALIRRDLSLRIKEVVQLAGLAVIVLLMVTVIFFDLRRNLPDNIWPFSTDSSTTEEGVVEP